MTCNKANEIILRLDHGESPPPRVKKHLKACPECRRRTEELRAVESALLLAASNVDRDVVRSVMVEIERTETYPIRKHSFLNWIFGGVLLAAALVAVQHSVPFRFLTESVLGPTVELSVTVAIGIALVAYIGVFVVVNSAHLEELLRHVPGATDRE